MNLHYVWSVSDARTFSEKMKGKENGGSEMRGLSMALVAIILMTGGLSGSILITDGGSVPASRGSFATHDAGNFTIIIDDDGGATGWDTLEFPSGEDRLSSAYFGIGTASDKVDFGKEGEFQTEDVLTISSPGNYTDEEGYARFSGWNGEDFDDVNITQRTFLNKFEDEVTGHTGRWMVVDYLIEAPETMESSAYLIQTMNVDLGASASDDSFSFISDINATVISDGTTFVGLGYFSHNSVSRFHGHNAGPYGPGVYSNESNVWGQMSSPNDEPSSATEQDWYMDLTAMVQREDTGDPFHISFIVLVGSSIYDMKEAYFDAVNALKGEWKGPDLNEWQTGEIELQFEYDGPIFPPSYTSVFITNGSIPGHNLGSIVPQPVPGTKNMSLVLNTSSVFPDRGDIRWEITSIQHWGYFDQRMTGSFLADNAGPNTTLSYVNDDPLGTLKIRTMADDRGGSGTAETYMSLDGEYFVEAGSLDIFDDLADVDVYAYSVDEVGNEGPISNITDMINDGTAPSIFNVSIDPSDIDEDTAGPVVISFEANDAISGVDNTTAQLQWGIENILPIWLDMEVNGNRFNYSISNDWYEVQGYDLVYSLRVSDNMGNTKTSLFNETVDALNDLPEFNLTLTGPEFITNEVGMVINGSDEDGDDINFTFEYQLGNGSWMEVLPEFLNWTDEYHCLFELPDIVFEGALNINAFADDGSGRIFVDNGSILLDTKPPVIGLDGIPDGQWSNATVNLQATAIDGVSGVFMIGFTVERNGEFEFIPASHIDLFQEGTFNVTIMAQDNAGNVRTLELDTIKIDMTPPVIEEMFSLPEEPEIGDRYKLYFRVSDDMGFDLSKVSQDPSLFINVSLISNDNTSYWMDAIPSSPDEGSFFIDLFEPLTMYHNGAIITISVRDEAGNRNTVRFGPIVVKDTIRECPLDIQYPEYVQVGEDHTITITWEGPVILEVSYPDTQVTWIISPKRTSGDERTYELPGPYVPDDIIFKVRYGEKGSDNMTGICPPEEWFRIGVTGWIDSDGDGLPDVYEDHYDLDKNSADPSSSDKDGDGLDILQEMTFMTDPNSADSDGDGMPDKWEVEWGTLPFRDDALDDPDDDGWSNWKEWDDSTDPRDENDHPDDPPPTPWYWMLIIFAALMAILIYFILQLFNKRKLEDDLEAMGASDDWDKDEE